jgi:hypothetical protein
VLELGVSVALQMLEKVESLGRVGKKRKTMKCECPAAVVLEQCRAPFRAWSAQRAR